MKNRVRNHRCKFEVVPQILLCAFALVLVGCDGKEKQPRRSLFGQGAVDTLLATISPNHIRELHITNAKLTDEHWTSIANFRDLEVLTLRCELDGHHLKYLRSHKKLRKLVILDQSLAVTDSNLEHISHLKQLREFALLSDHATDEGISFLQNGKRLSTLTLHCPLVTGTSLQLRRSAESMRHVDLSGCQLDDCSLQFCSELKYLRSLWIFKTGLSDDALRDLNENLWLVNFDPSERMTDGALSKFRTDLIGRRQHARDLGTIVPPDKILFINIQNRDVRGEPPIAGQSDLLDELVRSINQ